MFPGAFPMRLGSANTGYPTPAHGMVSLYQFSLIKMIIRDICVFFFVSV